MKNACSNAVKLCLGIASLMLLSCSGHEEKERDQDAAAAATAEQIIPKAHVQYAKGFSIKEKEGYKIITVTRPWKGTSDRFSYVLYTDKKPRLGEEFVYIQTPVSSFLCLSATHVGYMDALRALQRIKGVSNAGHIFNPEILMQVQNGRVAEVGDQQQINYEKVVDLSPGIVTAYGINENSSKIINKLKSLKQKPVIVAEYMENHPLGKAEWIKFFGALTGREKIADSLFNEVEKRYLRLSDTVYAETSTPEVFTGFPWNGVWYVPGGESFQARLFEDAGASYLWKKNKETSGVGLNFEVVFEKAHDADYWLNVHTFDEREDISRKDKRYKAFKAWKNGNVFNNNKRISHAGGNDYWESGVVRPDLILQDLVNIFHPGIFPDRELYYYQKLK